jgi:DNA repair exonuclease SbcCD ATPase subunit
MMESENKWIESDGEFSYALTHQLWMQKPKIKNEMKDIEEEKISIQQEDQEEEMIPANSKEKLEQQVADLEKRINLLKICEERMAKTLEENEKALIKEAKPEISHINNSQEETKEETKASNEKKLKKRGRKRKS